MWSNYSKVEMKFKFGLTGSTGSLGRSLILNNKKINFHCYRGDIRDKKKYLSGYKNINWIDDGWHGCAWELSEEAMEDDGDPMDAPPAPYKVQPENHYTGC